jgi:hypothetical protein
VAYIFPAIAIGLVGVFFLAGGFQGYGFNWFDEYCPQGGICTHPMITIGVGLIACAVAVFFVLKSANQT